MFTIFSSPTIKQQQIVFLPSGTKNQKNHLTRFNLLSKYQKGLIAQNCVATGGEWDRLLGYRLVMTLEINGLTIKTEVQDLYPENQPTPPDLTKANSFVIAIDITDPNWEKVLEDTMISYEKEIGDKLFFIVGMTDNDQPVPAFENLNYQARKMIVKLSPLEQGQENNDNLAKIKSSLDDIILTTAGPLPRNLTSPALRP